MARCPCVSRTVEPERDAETVCTSPGAEISVSLVNTVTFKEKEEEKDAA